MKKSVLFLTFSLLNILFCFSQEIINPPDVGASDLIHQISATGINNILSLQNINQGLGDIVLTQQSGNQNKVDLNQQSKDPGTTNQSFNFQQGNYNEFSMDQHGNGNLLLTFQVGYVIDELVRNQFNQYGFNLESGKANIVPDDIQNVSMPGERNKIEVSQEGINNGMLLIQQGNDNLISADQNGNNNYLLVLQKGDSNSVTGYKQENISGTMLYDTIIQEGDNLSIITDGNPRINPNKNIYSQTGVNLAIEINNGFVNSTGGIEVTQTGKDMKVVVDQSYFPMPLK